MTQQRRNKATNPNDSAFPSESDHHGGLTKLEYMAKDFMSAMLSNPDIIEIGREEIIGDLYANKIAKASIRLAKSLINEINNQEETK